MWIFSAGYLQKLRFVGKKNNIINQIIKTEVRGGWQTDYIISTHKCVCFFFTCKNYKHISFSTWQVFTRLQVAPDHRAPFVYSHSNLKPNYAMGVSTKLSLITGVPQNMIGIFTCSLENARKRLQKSTHVNLSRANLENTFIWFRILNASSH